MPAETSSAGQPIQSSPPTRASASDITSSSSSSSAAFLPPPPPGCLHQSARLASATSRSPAVTPAVSNAPSAASASAANLGSFLAASRHAVVAADSRPRTSSLIEAAPLSAGRSVSSSHPPVNMLSGHSRSLSHPVTKTSSSSSSSATAVPAPVPASPPLGPSLSSSSSAFPLARSLSLSGQPAPPAGATTTTASTTAAPTSAAFSPTQFTPLTPTRSSLPRGLSLQLPSRNQPLAPYLDPALGFSTVRRPRLDFTRSCTSLHHSFVADSPDSSPLTPSMPIPRRGLDSPIAMYTGGAGSMLSTMLADSRVQSDDSSDTDSSDDDEMELVSATSQFGPSLPGSGMSDVFNSSALLNRRHMTRLRGKGRSRQSSSSASASSTSLRASPSPTTPPNGEAKKAGVPIAGGGYFGHQLTDMLAQRRQSISAAMKKIGFMSGADDAKGQENVAGKPQDVVRRPVTRRGNLLPKPKHFQRVKAALIEEATPIDAEMRIEAAIQRQLREEDEEQDNRTVPQTPVLQAQAEEEHPLVFDDTEDESGGLTFKSAAQRNSGYWGSLESSSPSGFMGFRINPDGDIIMGTDSMVNSPISRSPEVRKLKRRRDDEDLVFDQPSIIKRRAVSPGFSQSPTVSSSPVAIPANAAACMGAAIAAAGGIGGGGNGGGTGASGGTRSKRSSYIQDAHDGLSKMSISPFL